MAINPARFEKLLSELELGQLFNECGWDNTNLGPQEIQASGEAFRLTAIAQKRGVVVFLCGPDTEGKIPARPVQLKIDKEVNRIAHEHLLIFTDSGKTALTWLWVSRAPGQPTITRTHTWHKDTSGESLRQKLESIVWSLEEEDAITLTDVITGLRRAFDRDRISKSFYDRFKREHEKFSDFIEGLQNVTGGKAWYASLMLNRLMFVYFIQRKGFLDNNVNYLTDKFQEVRNKKGKGHFHSFYRTFLRQLFHKGLGTPVDKRAAGLDSLVGKVPYLNGGLFDIHELEKENPNIGIPDEAFGQLFEFFDAYDWHLDDRPLAKGNEINPDVLGYIFEKYVNQKQMGAYYSKEDITEYISKNTVIPWLLEQAQERCKVAFEGEESVWNLLKNDPEKYIYPAMKAGVIDETGKTVPESILPDFVQTGMHDAEARMFNKNYNLSEALFSTTTGERGTLLTETWREYVERRKRCLEIRKKLTDGEVKSIEELITLNLDIRQFMQDIIDTSTGPQLLRAIWQAIVGRVPERSHEKFLHGISILDPTCGSGAFLFAALNVLEPLYEACLDRMEGFIEDAAKLDKPKEADFVKALQEVSSHSSRRYFVYKNIILHNLFGVDIMAEAVELCKLRLFLKLVSQVGNEDELEPLPDIDFNIRTGNALVGFATEKQFDESSNLASDQDQRDNIKAGIADLADLFDRFREQQTVQGGKIISKDKQRLRDKLKGLDSELDQYLAKDYGIDPEEVASFNNWRESHQPFHWFAEFYRVMRSGGFDVVIGNPPYVEYNKELRQQYSLLNYGTPQCDYSTQKCGNLYAFIVERSMELFHEQTRFSMVVPVSIASAKRMQSLRDCFSGYQVYHSHFADRPSSLFPGVHQMVSIVTAWQAPNAKSMTSTSFQHWKQDERPALFQTITYHLGSDNLPSSWYKLAHPIESNIFSKIISHRQSLTSHFSKQGEILSVCGGTGGYFLRAFPEEIDAREYKRYFVGKGQATPLSAILNSSLFYWFWRKTSNSRHLNLKEIEQFKYDISDQTPNQLNQVGQNYIKALQSTRTDHEGVFTHPIFRPGLVKATCDRIDHILAECYGMTNEELDFIINYDIKYRMGGVGDET
ncbi:MAG: Eco57I restriction-modification methylase domain-containing protein [Pseudohongiellaceae bacterium]